MPTSAEIAALIRQKAAAYAAARGRPEDADAFARVITAIAYGESGLNPSAVRDTRMGNDPLVASGAAQRELSVGLFQNNMMGGRGSGYTVEQLKDPNLNIDISLPQLWGEFQRQGGTAAFARDPVQMTSATYKHGQGSVWPSVQTQVLPGLAVTGGGAPPAGGSPAATTASAPPATPVPAPAAPGRSPTVAVDSALIQERDAIRADITAISTRIGELSDAISGKVKRSDGRPWDSEQLEDFQLELKERTAALNQARNLLATYSKLISDQQQTPSSQGMTEAERATLGLGFLNYGRGVAADERTAAVQLAGLDATRDQNAFVRQQAATENRIALGNLASQLIQAGFANNLAKQTFLLNALKESEGRVQAQVADAVQRGEVSFNQAATITAALATKQAAEIARVGKVAEIANWINDTDFRNMERLLPEGVTEIPGFGANSPANVVRGRLGLPPLVIEAVRVDPSKLDPRTSFADAQGLAPPVGDFEIDRQRQAYEDFQKIPKYTPTTLDPEAMVAAVGETPTFKSVWENLPELGAFAEPAAIDPALRAQITGGGSGGSANPQLNALLQSFLYGTGVPGAVPPDEPPPLSPAAVPPQQPVDTPPSRSQLGPGLTPAQAGIGRFEPATNTFAPTGQVLPSPPADPAAYAALMPQGSGLTPAQPKIDGDDIILPDGTRIFGAAKRFLGQAALGAGRQLLGAVGAR